MHSQIEYRNDTVNSHFIPYYWQTGSTGRLELLKVLTIIQEEESW